MKVIFLDIDGVLNSHETCKYYHELYKENGFGGFFREDDEPTIKNTKLGQCLVDNLKTIIEATDSVIVVSSTWRKHYDTQVFEKMFALYGLQAKVIDKTPNYSTRFKRAERGFEIKEWLCEHENITSYVIIDDDNDMLAEQESNFVQTSFEVGLSQSDAIKAIEILNRN